MMYYSASMNTLDESLTNAVKEGELLESSLTNIRLLLAGTKSPIARPGRRGTGRRRGVAGIE